MSIRQVLVESVSFVADNGEIERVKEFRYLGRIFTDNDDDTKCIKANIKRPELVGGEFSKVLKREGADARSMSSFY